MHAYIFIYIGVRGCGKSVWLWIINIQHHHFLPLRTEKTQRLYVETAVSEPKPIQMIIAMAATSPTLFPDQKKKKKENDHLMINLE